MKYASIASVLQQLKTTADQIRGAFPAIQWKKIAGSGPETLLLDNATGTLSGLTLQHGPDLHLCADMDLPANVLGIPLAGQPVEVVVSSSYPCELRFNHHAVFSDQIPPVAVGPALMTMLPVIKPGHNGVAELIIRIPKHQLSGFFNLKLTTPAFRSIAEQIDVVRALLMLADEFACTESERTAVAQAANVAQSIVCAQDPAERDSLFNQFARILRPFDGKVSQTRVHLIGHSHIDMNWLWTWPDTVQVILRDMRSILSLMQQFPELTFSHSQAATYDVLHHEAPELFSQVLEHIRSGRWEVLSMQWVEGDVNMASGEAQVRQLLEGVHYSHQALGIRPTTFHAPDTFGHAGNLPQIAASAGALRYYHHRCNPGQAAQWPIYWWEGQDGTRLLALSTPSYNGEINPVELAAAAVRAHQLGHPAALYFHGIGDHGGGPTRQSLQTLRRLKNIAGFPTLLCSTIEAYTRDITHCGVALPIHHGESRTIYEGCYTTHADAKHYNRQSENLLCTADTLAVLAGQNHNDLLHDAWRKTLFNQFHDILDGSAIHETYEDHATDFSAIQSTAAHVIDAALITLQSALTTGSIAVTNQLGWDRDDWVLISDQHGHGEVWLIGDHGHIAIGQYTDEGLGFIARAPAFGTVSYRVCRDRPMAGSGMPVLQAVPAFAPTDSRSLPLSGAHPEDTPYFKVETPSFRVLVRKDCGVMTSFFDKRAARELVAFGLRRASDYIDTARPELAMNVFQILDEHPHGMSAWQHHEVASEQSLISGGTVRMLESGPVRCVLECIHRIRSSTIKQRIIFYNQIDRVDFQTHLDWREIGNGAAGVPNLKVAFTARLLDAEAWYETPFAAVRRPADGQEVPALRWADIGGPAYGFALLNDSKYGYDALGSRLRLSLVRSAYEPDAISDIGEHDIRYALLPHIGDWRQARVVQAAAGFNQPLLARTVASSATESTSLPRPILDGDPSILISCLKTSRDGCGYIIRLYESQGRSAVAHLRGLSQNAHVVESNILEDPLRELPLRDGAVELPFRPWELRTLRIA